MHGIVSLLDDKHYQIVEDLWAELKREFSVEGVYVTPYPHFSYQVARHYDPETLIARLHEFASSRVVFQVRTGGLGIFTGASPILYIPVVRSPELTQFHQVLCQHVSEVGEGIQDYYHPEHWLPHITIGFGDMNRDTLPRIVGYLSDRDFNWEITVDNIALIYDTGTRQELRERFKLSGSGEIEQRPPTIGIDPALLRRIEKVASEHQLSVGEYLGRVLDFVIPTEANTIQKQTPPPTSELLQRVLRERERIMQESGGQLFEDSAEAVRRMREERTQYLEH